MSTRTIKVTNLTGLVKELQFRKPNNPIIEKSKLRNTLFIWSLGANVNDLLSKDDSPTVCMECDVEGDKVVAATFAGSNFVLTVVEA